MISRREAPSLCRWRSIRPVFYFWGAFASEAEGRSSVLSEALGTIPLGHWGPFEEHKPVQPPQP